MAESGVLGGPVVGSKYGASLIAARHKMGADRDRLPDALGLAISLAALTPTASLPQAVCLPLLGSLWHSSSYQKPASGSQGRLAIGSSRVPRKTTHYHPLYPQCPMDNELTAWACDCWSPIREWGTRQKGQGQLTLCAHTNIHLVLR